MGILSSRPDSSPDAVLLAAPVVNIVTWLGSIMHVRDDSASTIAGMTTVLQDVLDRMMVTEYSVISLPSIGPRLIYEIAVVPAGCDDAVVFRTSFDIRP